MIGKIICDIDPSAQNRRNSEGTFITLKDGKILFVYSRYDGSGWTDFHHADLYGMISKDNGETFTEPFPVLLCEDVGATNIMSPSLLRMQNGDVGLFFLVKHGETQCQYYMCRSDDEGKTWGKPILCSGSDGYFVVNNHRVIRCSNGRILIPCAFIKIEDVPDENINPELVVSRATNRKLHPGTLYVFASDDDGFTWKAIAEDIAQPYSRGCTTGIQEPGFVELEENTIWCFIRNNSGTQYESFSYDNGVTWSQPGPSPFTSPRSPMSATKLSDGRIIAVWNPIPGYNGRPLKINGKHTIGRTPLVMAVSTDNGNKFSEPIMLEPDPNDFSCYTAIHETEDGSVLLAYCLATPEDECILSRTRIRKIPLSDF